MGSPKKQKKKYSKPTHPWQKERILAEEELSKAYGLKRKYEIWKMSTILKNFTNQAKNLITTKTQQSDLERNQLLNKLSSLGLIGSNAKIEDVLTLTLKDVMERRLQTLVYRKNMTGSLKQARQFVVHEHISIGDKIIATPSYLVPVNEETNIQFVQSSTLANLAHPERIVSDKKKDIKKPKEKINRNLRRTEGLKSKKETKIKKKKPKVAKETKGE